MFEVWAIHRQQSFPQNISLLLDDVYVDEFTLQETNADLAFLGVAMLRDAALFFRQGLSENALRETIRNPSTERLGGHPSSWTFLQQRLNMRDKLHFCSDIELEGPFLHAVLLKNGCYMNSILVKTPVLRKAQSKKGPTIERGNFLGPWFSQGLLPTSSGKGIAYALAAELRDVQVVFHLWWFCLIALCVCAQGHLISSAITVPNYQTWGGGHVETLGCADGFFQLLLVVWP